MIGTSHALHELRPDGVMLRYSALQGLPVGHATVLSGSTDTNASLWIGTPDGLVEMEPTTSTSTTSRLPSWRYYSGDRWVPTNTATNMSVITAVATSLRDGEATTGVDMVWVGTDVGVSIISMVPMTLEGKAQHYQSMVSPRHDRCVAR
jgi:ligand-binding sensor domain-containing protein